MNVIMQPTAALSYIKFCLQWSFWDISWNPNPVVKLKNTALANNNNSEKIKTDIQLGTLYHPQQNVIFQHEYAIVYSSHAAKRWLLFRGVKLMPRMVCRLKCLSKYR